MLEPASMRLYSFWTLLNCYFCVLNKIFWLDLITLDLIRKYYIINLLSSNELLIRYFVWIQQ